jgi:hypothetical protein
VQWSTPVTSKNFCFDRAGLRERLIGGHGYEGVQHRVQFLDLLQARAGEFNW